MPDTTQTIIKNLIPRTTIRSTSFEVTELDTTVTQEGSTHSSIIYTTDKITPIPTSQTRKQASSNTKPETTIISTSVPDENTEEITTEWFYPTTKPKTGSLYNLVQELPFRNPDNTIPRLYSDGAPLRTSDTNFPWIFPKWISDQKLSNPNQVPRLLQF